MEPACLVLPTWLFSRQLANLTLSAARPARSLPGRPFVTLVRNLSPPAARVVRQAATQAVKGAAAYTMLWQEAAVWCHGR